MSSSLTQKSLSSEFWPWPICTDLFHHLITENIRQGQQGSEKNLSHLSNMVTLNIIHVLYDEQAPGEES